MDDFKVACKRAGLKRLWKKLMSNIDFAEKTRSADQVFLGCTQREQNNCGGEVGTVHRAGITQYKHDNNFKSDTKHYVISCSYDMQGRAQKCVERYCELANKTTNNFHKVSTPRLDHHHFNNEELENSRRTI